MGFRLFKLTPLNKTLISKISSNKNNNVNRYAQIQLLNYNYYSENPNFKISKRWHVGHSHEGEKIFRLGLAADIGLATGKALTGYLTGSTAIIADAAHSISDVVLSGVALLSYKAARVPKDKEHPYGHF